MQETDEHMWSLYTSTKGSDCLRVDDYSYYKIHTNEEDSITWRCSKRKCYATVHTNTSTSIMTPTRHVHTHSPRHADYFKRLKTRHGVKRRASEYPDQKILKMVILEVEENEGDDCFQDRDVVNLRRSVSRVKLSSRGTLPRSREEAIQALEEEMTKNSVKGAHLIKVVEKDIVMLATDHSLQLLRGNDFQFFGDGTFRYCPKYFYQKYTIHIFKDGFYIPVAYFLLSNKTEKTYKRMCDLIKPHCDISMMTLDFEPKPISAFEKQFPGVIIRCCRFHLAQNWQKKFRALGFQTQYNSRRGPIAAFLKSLFGLPCMPVDEVSEFFNEELAKNAPRPLNPPEKALKYNFIEYLRKTYMNPNSTYPPHLWAGVGHSDIKCTTNGCENYHRHFKDWFSSPKPDIYTFLANLHLSSIHFKIRSNSQRIVHPREDALFIRQMWNEVRAGNVSKTEFISLCAHFSLPVAPRPKTGMRKSQRLVKQAKQDMINRSIRNLRRK